MLNLSSIIQRSRHDPVDDFRIVRSWKEYTDDRKYMKYLMYELEMMEDNGNVVHFYKAVKFTRIIRLPKSAKQSESFMDMHGQVLAAGLGAQYQAPDRHCQSSAPGCTGSTLYLRRSGRLTDARRRQRRLPTRTSSVCAAYCREHTAS